MQLQWACRASLPSFLSCIMSALLLPAAALDLINEPRCYQCGTALHLWVQEMAAFVKGLDRNHLLTVRGWAGVQG